MFCFFNFLLCLFYSIVAVSIVCLESIFHVANLYCTVPTKQKTPSICPNVYAVAASHSSTYTRNLCRCSVLLSTFYVPYSRFQLTLKKVNGYQIHYVYVQHDRSTRIAIDIRSMTLHYYLHSDAIKILKFSSTRTLTYRSTLFFYCTFNLHIEPLHVLFPSIHSYYTHVYYCTGTFLKFFTKSFHR